jgi:predicted dehydrogenase
MNVLVIGLGSMGKRRIRLIQKLIDGVSIYGIDNKLERTSQLEKEKNITCYNDINKCDLSIIDCAFVCTSPLSHGEIINALLKHKINVFSEINLVDTLYKENIELAKKNDAILFLSSTFLYREEIKYIDKIVKEEKKPMVYTYHIGQYLPDWHPWENYKDYFVGNDLTNGCREIFAIELPWILNTFGDIKDFSVSKDKNSSLNINFADNYIVKIEHKNGSKGVLIVDLISRKPIRKLDVYNENEYLSWEGTTDSLKRFDIESKEDKPVVLYDKIDKDAKYNEFIIENDYQEEVVSFFKCLRDKENKFYNFENDLYTLSLINKIEGKYDV